MVWGSVRATTRPPALSAADDAASWWAVPAGFEADTPSTFQFTGRPARTEILLISSTSASSKPLRHPGRIISTVVPGWEATAAARRSSSVMLAEREGTG